VVLVMRIFDKTEMSGAQQVLLATEASILRQLHHPNIVETVREHETPTRLCQVFELSVVRRRSALALTFCSQRLDCYNKSQKLIT